MKNIKLEKLPSGSYRIRKMINGKNLQIVFDHKPSQSEVIKALSPIADTTPVRGSFQSCAEKYIDAKNNVLSPATIRGYQSILRNLPDTFKRRKLSQITQADIQAVVNEYKADHSAKSTINAHGFIVGILRMFRPSMGIHTT